MFAVAAAIRLVMRIHNSPRVCRLDIEATYSLLAKSFCVTRPAGNALSGIAQCNAVAGDLEFGTSGIVLEVEGVELLSNAVESSSSFIRVDLSVLGGLSSLLLALLWANDALFSKRGF